MKHLKKIMSLILTAIMVIAMCVPVMADNTTTTTYKITAPATTHIYEIYQIFTGDLHEGTLSNVKWGTNGKLPTGVTVGSAVDKSILDELNGVSANSTDRQKLTVVEQYANLTVQPVATITNKGYYDAVPGYYLIKDQDDSITGDDAYTTYLVKVVGTVNIAPKSGKPSVDKQVLDETNDAEEGATDGWGESADHAINESFKFKLIATIPDDMSITT